MDASSFVAGIFVGAFIMLGVLIWATYKFGDKFNK